MIVGTGLLPTVGSFGAPRSVVGMGTLGIELTELNVGAFVPVDCTIGLVAET